MAVAPVLTDVVSRWITMPNVVVELLLGILIGPVALGWAADTPVVAGLADFGLAMLMFLAGSEIDYQKIKGRPLGLAVVGWLISLALGLAAGGLTRGWNVGGLVVGLALTTTALGSILPIISDAGILHTSFGSRIMAIGSAGEFGPIVAIALLLTSDQPAKTSLLLLAFAAIAVAAGVLAVRRSRHPLLTRLVGATLHTSGQLAIRLSMLTIVLMLWITESFGLDVLLGAFAAGVIEHLALESAGDRERETVKSKLEAIGFGFTVPFFFVVSGLKLDLKSLFGNPVVIALIPIAFVLFLVVRGGPTWLLTRLLYGRAAGSHESGALAVMSATGLPLVVVITTIGTEAGVLKAGPAAALVCAGMLSVLIFPLAALRMLRATSGPRPHRS
jgi:Kef-type K+ transport system membrane component KefB